MKGIKRKIVVIIAAILLVSSVLGICSTAAVSVGVDSSLAGSSGNVTLSSVELLERYLGEEIGDAEREFFGRLADTGALKTVEIAYNETINTSKVNVTYGAGALTVSALEYSYEGVNGKSFVWIPTAATLGEITVSLEKHDDAYVGKIDCTEPDKNSRIKVSYSASVDVLASDINAIVDLYRNVAEYSSERIEYEAYVIEKKLYDEAVARYEKYLSDLEEYDRLLYEYENYETVTLPKYDEDIAKYQKYETDKKEYDQKLAEYQAYLKEYSKIEKQLSAVKLIYTPMTLGRTVYDAVMGGTVDQVLENQSAVVAAGADKRAVELGREATIRVRSLMVGYKACKDDVERYAYYTANYDNFCQSFLQLTQCLDVLYTKAVRAYLIANDKNHKYVILVAQLALISNALIDSPIRNYNGAVSYTSSWKFDGKTIAQTLENKTYFVDDNTSAPMDVPKEVKKPDDLVEVKKPVYPQKPEMPILPDPVSHPGDAPAVVSNPDSSLKQPEFSTVYKALGKDYAASLKAAYEEGALPKARRKVNSSKVSFDLSTSVVKTYNAESVTVSFKMPDGSVSDVVVDKGSPVVCEAKIPVSYVDAEGDTWVLIGWGVSDKALVRSYTGAVDLRSGFSENTVLEPIYEHYYTITWEIDGTVYTKNVSALENAVCPVLPSKADDGDMYYEFIGWLDEYGVNVGEEIGKPERDGKYVASFDKKYIVPYAKEGGAKITYEDGNVICDSMDQRNNATIDISKLVLRAAEKQCTLTLKVKRGTLKFTFTDVLALKEQNAKTISVDYSGSSLVDNYNVKILDSEGKSLSVNLELTSQTQSESTEKYKLYRYLPSGEKSYVKYHAENQTVTFTAESGVKYEFRAEFDVRFVPNDLVEFVVSNSSPLRNEIVSYQIVPKEGVEILEILIEDDLGNPIKVYGENYALLGDTDSKEKGIFQISVNDVNVSVYARYKTYAVTFKANGKIVYQTSAEYGSTLNVPKAPKVGDDGVYSYEFIGWDKEITPVTCEITYEAVYKKTPLPVYDGGLIKLSPKLKKLFYIAVVMFLVFTCGTTLLVIRLTKKRRKKKAERNGFASYGEYRANKKLLKADLVRKTAEEVLDREDEKIEEAYEKLEKAQNKCEKAKQRLKNAKHKRILAEEKLNAKRNKKKAKKDAKTNKKEENITSEASEQ